MQLDAERDEVNWIAGRRWSELGNGNVYLKVTGALIAQLGRGIAPESIERLVAAGRLLLGSVLRVDDILDEQPRGVALASRVFGALAGQFEATRKLAQLFAHDAPFWDHMREHYVLFADSQIVEQEYRTGERSWRDADEQVVRNLAIGKNAVMFVASAALCELAGAEPRRPELDAAVTDFIIAAQTLDDAVDWRTDLRQGVPTLVLWRTARRLQQAGDVAEPDVRQALLGGGEFRVALHDGLGAIERARHAPAFAGNAAWRALCGEIERGYRDALEVFGAATVAPNATVWAGADAFWDALLPTLWRRSPGVVTEPGVDSLGGPADVMRALRSLRAANHGRLRVRSLRCFRGIEEQLPFVDWLPEPTDATLDDYAERIGRRVGDDVAGIMVSELQALDWSICKGAMRFLAELHRRVGAPLGGATLDLFHAVTAAGFTALHKDSQDVFTFIVRGTKRFYLWPFEKFRDKAGLSPTQDLGASVLDNVDWRSHVDVALVVDGAPGDVLYWPAAWWHVAENGDGGATTLALGVMHEGNPFRAATAAIAALEAEGVSIAVRSPVAIADAASELGARMELLASVSSDPRFGRALAEAELGHITGCGLRELPPISPRAPLTDGDTITLAAPGGVALVQQGGQLVWSGCGRSFACPDVPEIRALLQLLPQRPTWRIGRLLDEVVPVGSESARAKLRAVLELVRRVCAVDVG